MLQGNIRLLKIATKTVKVTLRRFHPKSGRYGEKKLSYGVFPLGSYVKHYILVSLQGSRGCRLQPVLPRVMSRHSSTKCSFQWLWWVPKHFSGSQTIFYDLIIKKMCCASAQECSWPFHTYIICEIFILRVRVWGAVLYSVPGSPVMPHKGTRLANVCERVEKATYFFNQSSNQ